MGKSYFASRISENLGKTPEGYVIAHGVPICRTGWQDYTRREIGLKDGDPNAKVRVYRSPTEVFAPLTIASFEGKTVTDNHPSEWVDPSNEGSYNRGHGQNVRRGTGEFADCLVADLLMKEAILIDKVLNKSQRDVSCGYFCVYDPIDGSDDMFAQREIRGNHIAVVPNGRAGSRVAIRDSAMGTTENKMERKSKLRKITLKGLLGLGLKTYAADAEPEDVAEAYEIASKAKEGTEDLAAGLPPKPTGTEKKVIGADALEIEEEGKKGGEGGEDSRKTKDAGGERDERIIGMLEKVLQAIEHLATATEAAHPAPPEPEEQLDKFSKQLDEEEGEDEGGEAGEDEKLHHLEEDKDLSPEERKAMKEAGETIPFVDGENSIPPELSGEDLPKNPVADRKATKDFIARMKPIIAAMPDKNERQKAVDALISFAKTRRGAKPTPGYGALTAGALAQPKKDGAGSVTFDSVETAEEQKDAQWAEGIRQKYHRKHLKTGHTV